MGFRRAPYPHHSCSHLGCRTAVPKAHITLVSMVLPSSWPQPQSPHRYAEPATTLIPHPSQSHLCPLLPAQDLIKSRSF